MTLGERIAKCRKEKNLSQEYIAYSLGISRQSVSKWEQNITSPDTDNLIALAKLLDVSVEYIAYGKESKPQTVQIDENKPFSIFKIIGVVLFVAGISALILGFVTLWLVSVFGAFLVTFGILFMIFGKRGALLSLSMLLTCIFITLFVAFTSGVDIPIVLIITACSIVLPLAAFAVIRSMGSTMKKR